MDLAAEGITSFVNLEGVSSGLVNVALILGILVIGGVLGFLVWYLVGNYKKYSQFRVVIWENDGFGHVNELYDKAGIFLDKKSNQKLFFLKKFNVGLDCNDVPYVPGVKGSKVVYLVRTGFKTFRFIRPNIDKGVLTFGASEDDVNWAVNTYERTKRTFAQNTLLMYAPYIALVVVAVVIMIIFIYFFKNFEVLKDVALQFKETAQILAQAKAGSVIITPTP
jgi:hypothetical protein